VERNCVVGGDDDGLISGGRGAMYMSQHTKYMHGHGRTVVFLTTEIPAFHTRIDLLSLRGIFE